MGLPLASTGTSGPGAGCVLAFGPADLLPDAVWGPSGASSSGTGSAAPEGSPAGRSASKSAAPTSDANMHAAGKLESSGAFGIGVDPARTLRATPTITTAMVKRNQTILCVHGRLTLQATSRISGSYRLDRMDRISLYESFNDTKKARGIANRAAFWPLQMQNQGPTWASGTLSTG